MNDYFAESPRMLSENSCPIIPTRNTWEVVDSPERLLKRFEFSERPRLMDFVEEVMAFEDQKGHHSMIRIDHLTVDVEIYTRDLNRITELDREFAMTVDQIYRDVLDYVYQEIRI